MSCPSSCCLPFWRQCDRSAVGALWVEVPRVARRLAALARARPTAIPFDRSAVCRFSRALRHGYTGGSQYRHSFSVRCDDEVRILVGGHED